MWTDDLQEGFSDLIGRIFNDDVDLIQLKPVGGGCINDSYRVETSHGVFFLKYNDADRYPDMFRSEANGLKLLRSVAADREHNRNDDYIMPDVPRVVAQAEYNSYSMLILEFVESGSKSQTFWIAFGSGLAGLHQQTNNYFGLDHSNYIGSLPQSNRLNENWIDFFVSERLEAQIKLARDSGRAGRDLVQKMAKLYPFLGDFFPAEPPALLHGDLWSGNYMVNKTGMPTIVDPAVYYGHRYMDLGMTRLFGGFSEAFYEAYRATYPLEKNWKEGTDVANLYPLLVHLNLFGGGYLTSILDVLKRFR